jgi:ribonuclease BN (tRNA processing enzyme)
MKIEQVEKGACKPPFSVSRVSSISLTNGGTLEVYCLGAGSMVSSTHGTTSYLVVKGDDHILIDCGPTTPYALHQMGVRLNDVHVTHITHVHTDHVAGFPKMLVHNRYIHGATNNKKMSLLVNPVWANILWERTLSGDLATHDFADPSQSNPTLWYDIVPSMEQSSDGRVEVYKVGGIRMETFRTAHAPASTIGWQNCAWSTGVLIDDKVWISGDTRFDPELISLYVPRAEVFFHDTASGKSPLHASLDELSRSLRLSVRSRMIPIHYGDEWVKDRMPSSEALELVKKKGFLGLAYTGMKVEFAE